jgi:hypothetical protein
MATVQDVWVAIGFVALASLATSGCNAGGRPGTAHVEGTVTINGQPLPADAQANITFAPSTRGGRSAGAVITNGKYDCPDAPVGKVKVYLSVMRRTGRMITESDNRPYAEMGSIIASKYASGIDAEITGDNANQDFDLEPAQQ